MNRTNKTKRKVPTAAATAVTAAAVAIVAGTAIAARISTHTHEAYRPHRLKIGVNGLE